MTKINMNGNGKLSSDDILKGKEIEFPVTYHLKVVMMGTEDDDKNKQKLVEVFMNNNIVYAYHDKKISSKGAYVSFTYEITLIDKDQMNKLYSDLKNIKEIKFAV